MKFFLKLSFKLELVSCKVNKKLIFKTGRLLYTNYGEVAERSKAAVLKTVEG